MVHVAAILTDYLNQFVHLPSDWTSLKVYFRMTSILGSFLIDDVIYSIEWKMVSRTSYKIDIILLNLIRSLFV